MKEKKIFNLNENRIQKKFLNSLPIKYAFVNILLTYSTIFELKS